LAASLIDVLMFVVLYLILRIVSEVIESPTANALLVHSLVVGVLALILVQITLLTRRGQTLGKIALGLRIVRMADGSNPGFRHALVLRALVPALIFALPFVGRFFALIDLLTIFGDDSRCLHDVIADTKVVEI
jgi:uncharacterized RDD family membrane protein YckC